MPQNLRIKSLPVADLVPYARNARTHTPAQVAQIAESITEYSFTNPVLVDGEGGIIAGHGRVLAALMLNLDKVPCIVLKHLTEAQKRAYILADNKIALNAGWDQDILRVELTELANLDVDLSFTGFSDKELEGLAVFTGEVNGHEPNTVQIGADRNLLQIEVETEGELSKLYDEMTKRGLQCKVLD